MRPLGAVQYRKADTGELITGGYKFNEETFLKRIDINEDEWYDQWHTLQVVLEDRTMELYYDGKQSIIPWKHRRWIQFHYQAKIL